MATNGLVTPVVDGPGIYNRFGGADDVLDRPECLVDVSHRLGIVDGIGAQNPEPIVARFGFDLLFINREIDRPPELSDSDGNLCYRPDSCPLDEVVPLSARQWPLGRAHPYGVLLH
jgi:hypothetical protein